MENKIEMENIYNMDETDTILDMIQVSRIIIDKDIGSQFQDESGRQEWMIMVECIYTDGISIPPMIIFKVIDLNEQILSQNIASDD